MKVIATATLTGFGNIVFSNIPGDFDDLMIKYSIRAQEAGSESAGAFCRVNNSNADYKTNGDTVESAIGHFLGSVPANNSAGHSAGEIYFPDYKITNRPKSSQVTCNGAIIPGVYNTIAQSVSRTNTNDAITTLTLRHFFNNQLASGSSATLYGITRS
jgi:hypothetical protein